jgi:hypothetical protein
VGCPRDRLSVGFFTRLLQLCTPQELYLKGGQHQLRKPTCFIPAQSTEQQSSVACQGERKQSALPHSRIGALLKR